VGPLTVRYLDALERHLERADESALHLAYEIGRSALKEGHGVLAMASAHHEALTDLAETGIDGPEVERAAELFFVEALAAFEMAHRGFREAAGILNELNDQLEREIRRIAHSLHDDVQQLLAAVSIQIEDVRRDLAEPAAKQLGAALEQLEQAAASVRHLSHELRPTILDDFGLVPALEYLAETFSKGGQLRVSVEGGAIERLKPAVEIALYRVVQESLTNIVRHARARRARIGVRSTRGNLRLRIRDDGVGFDVEGALRRGGQRGLGLAGMKKRVEALVGLLQIQSVPGKGTDIVVTIPLSAATGGGEHGADPSRAGRRPQSRSGVPARAPGEGGVRGHRRRG
jgi:signal transduction histidine kinase